MGASEFSSSSTITRLKREDCKRTKHDSAFSEWKILIGPSDWENYLLGKEGIERYRIHNLPLQCSCPGLYELGIAASQSNLGRDIRKLDHRDRIIVVYLGQADNVRTRLQHYGRAGSHLDHGNSIGYFDANQGSFTQKGPGLFKEIFSRGFAIVFRWASMENKKEAEKTEAQLLRVFDYAWNKGGNGIRRPNDIILKLDKVTSTTAQFPYIARKLQQWLLDKPLIQKQSGIRIKASSPPSRGTQSDISNDWEMDKFRARIFKFGRTQPRLVSDKFGTNEESVIICGVALGDGSVCKLRPVEGRKRCEDHKGKRINEFITRPVTGKSIVCGFDLEDGSLCSKVALHGRKRCEIHEQWTVLDTSLVDSDRKPLIEDHIARPVTGKSIVCGLGLEDGSICSEAALHGRKRCEIHEQWVVLDPSLINSDENPLIEDHITRPVTGKSIVCGLGLEVGSVCSKVSLHGKKRCEIHEQWTVLDTSLISSDRKPLIEDHASICGVVLGDGSVCKSKPIEGRKRCGEHKGQRVQGSISSSRTEGKSLLCGVGLGDGSVCMEVPVHGRKRCELHKGRRITTR